jgi:hypothetical protein
MSSPAKMDAIILVDLHLRLKRLESHCRVPMECIRTVSFQGVLKNADVPAPELRCIFLKILSADLTTEILKLFGR